MRRNGVSYLLIALALVAVCTPAFAKRQYDFKQITLDNGLRVVTLEDFSCPVVAVQVWYHVGSKNEDPARQGFAHMFEHMMFRGTDKVGPEGHFDLIRKQGGDCNAFTSFDYTAYVNHLPSSQLDLALWLEADRMMGLKIDQEGFDTERKVVEEERRMDINQPYGTVMEQVEPILFKVSPYRWAPIGNIPQLRAATIDELEKFWDTYYVPDNATLVIVGAVKHAQAQALARKYFGWMPKAPQPPEMTVREPAQTAPLEANISEPIGPVPMVGYVYRSAPENHPDFIPIEALMGILGDGESSRLYQDLVKEKQLCAQVIAETYGLELEGVLGAGAALRPTSDPDKVLAEIDSHLKELVEKPVTQRELDKVKNQMRRSLVTSALKVSSKARQIGHTAIIFKDPEELNRELKEIKKVTIADVQRVAKTYLKPEARTVLRVTPAPKGTKPGEDEGAPPAAKENKVATRTGVKAGVKPPDAFPSAPPLQPNTPTLPEEPMTEKTLGNGLKVVVVPNHETPFATIMLAFRYGAWAEDPATPGAASMAADMITKGTEHYTAVQLAEEVEFNALTLDGAAGMDDASVSATCLSDKLPLAAKLLAEVTLRPTFPESEFAILKNQRQVSLSIRAQDPDYLADRELRRRLYGEHPYARTVVGELEDVARLTPAAVAKWWKTFVRPEGAVLYVAGDVKPSAVFKLAEKELGAWKAEGPAPNPTIAPIPALQDSHIYLVNKPGSVQSQIRVAQVSITRGHPDYHRSRVFTQIFGGSFGSRLNKYIRVERGLTYGANGGFTPARFSGTFAAETFTKNPSTADTVQALIDTVTNMRKTPPTDEEISTARSYLTGSLAGDQETPQDVVKYQWMIESNRLPKDYLKQAMAAYTVTQPGDVSRIAENIVKTDKLTIVVVGEAKDVKEGLEKIAPVTVVEAPAAPEGQGPKGQGNPQK
ncbi:MAG: insulinase family protein [Candidatus Hydrogenedentes bacterium]|nr:insulinase family protein [Candidatus Hydrogenedentota bacterium]